MILDNHLITIVDNHLYFGRLSLCSSHLKFSNLPVQQPGHGTAEVQSQRGRYHDDRNANGGVRPWWAGSFGVAGASCINTYYMRQCM